MLFLAGHVSHQVVNKLVHLLHILGSLGLVLQAGYVIGQLEHQAALGVVVLGAVAHLSYNPTVSHSYSNVLTFIGS